MPTPDIAIVQLTIALHNRSVADDTILDSATVLNYSLDQDDLVAMMIIIEKVQKLRVLLIIDFEHKMIT